MGPERPAPAYCHLTAPVPFAANGGCGILECGRKRIALGMCWNHYQRNRRGLPLYVYLAQGKGERLTDIAFGPAAPPRSVRRIAHIRMELETNYTPEPNTGCWLWLGRFYEETGYGGVGNCRDPWGGYAHRAALYLRGTELAQRNRKRHVRHLCDNPACVNPAHLAYGTALENAADRAKGPRWAAWLERIAEVCGRKAVPLANGKTIPQMAAESGLNVETIRSRIKAGWPIDQLTAPLARRSAREAA